MSTVTVLQHTLANGLHIIGELNKVNKSCGIGFFVNTGSRDELPLESGVSHFLEHMLFKGTDKRNAIELTYAMGAIGAQANAYTSEENTVYYAGVLPEYLPQMQEILSDMMRPALDTEEFAMEKKVILEEIAMYLDRPHFYLFERASADFFATHPAGNSVLGTNESITALTRDQMKSYFDRRYAPSNMVLVVSGNFNWDTFLADAEAMCSSWPDFTCSRERPEFNFSVISKEYRKKSIQQAHVLLAAPGPAANEQERFAFALLATMLGDSSGSRLYWELVDKGIAETAGADHDDRDGVGMLSIYASMPPENLNQVKDIITRCTNDLSDFSDHDLQRAKTKLSTRLVMQGELPMGRLMALGSNWNYRKTIHSLVETIESVKSITHTDIAQALEKYPLQSWSNFALLPE